MLDASSLKPSGRQLALGLGSATDGHWVTGLVTKVHARRRTASSEKVGPWILRGGVSRAEDPRMTQFIVDSRCVRRP